MKQYIGRRILLAVASLAVVSVLVFVCVRLTGDPVRFYVAQDATPQDIARIRERLGLADPWPTQYVRFLGNLLRGDLGFSFRNRAPVAALMVERIGPTLSLMAAAVGVAVLASVPLGILAAVQRGTGFDEVIQVIALIGQSMPIFWSGLLLLLYLPVRFPWIPTSGYGTLRHLLLPTITLAAFLMASQTRLVRSSMLEVIAEDYMRTARAKGLGRRVVFYKHALRNAAISVVTIIGLQIGSLLGGAIVTETVFSWPGMGMLVINSVYGRDYPVVQAAVLLFATISAVITLALDIVYGVLDPRIRYS